MAEQRTREAIATDYQAARGRGDAAAMRRYQNEEACFVLLALSNLLVVIDRLVLPDVSLRTIRLWLTLLAVSVLLYGFIWEAERD